ncbi:MAG TPA: ATP-binding protein [Candidatus Acidoferrum sp.]|nr:ATP-binding protein [Candidatus Acidoferrum sp.]
MLASHLALFTPAPASARQAAGREAARETPESPDSPTNGLGVWIWAAQTFDRQTCLLWRSFEIPASTRVTQAWMTMTVDNEYTLFLDGRNVGRGAEWRHLGKYDLTQLLSPGKHVLAVEAYNVDAQAGMICGMRIDLADGRFFEIKSDQDWRIVPEKTGGWKTMTKALDTWPAATIMGPIGTLPWWTTPEGIDINPALQVIHTPLWQSRWFQITLLTLCATAILISFYLMSQLAFHQKERWLLQQERARIARDIHDDVGSRMTQLVLHGEVARNDLPAGSEACLQLDLFCEEARSLLSTMDEVLWAVNPRRDTLRDFVSYVTDYAQKALKRTSIQCVLDVEPEMPAEALDLPLRRNLLMAIKETLNNALKYSEATELLLQIQRLNQGLVVVVQDNGRGFDPAAAKPGRNGLANMTQRMTELGGECRVISQPGQGCRIEFRVPLNRSRRHLWNRIWRSRRFATTVIETKIPGGKSLTI